MEAQTLMLVVREPMRIVLNLNQSQFELMSFTILNVLPVQYVRLSTLNLFVVYKAIVSPLMTWIKPFDLCGLRFNA